MPREDPVSSCRELMTSSFSAARSESGTRPSATDVRSMGRPLRVAASMSAAQSTNVAAPGVRHANRIVDVARHCGPSSKPVMSTAMS